MATHQELVVQDHFGHDRPWFTEQRTTTQTEHAQGSGLIRQDFKIGRTHQCKDDAPESSPKKDVFLETLWGGSVGLRVCRSGVSGVSVRLGFFLDTDLFLMDAAVGLVVIDAQQALAVRKRASPAFGGCLQCFCHGYSLLRGFPPQWFRETGEFRNIGPGFSATSIPQNSPNPATIPPGAGQFELS